VSYEFTLPSLFVDCKGTKFGLFCAQSNLEAA